MTESETTISFPRFVSQINLVKDKDGWFCALTVGSYKDSATKGYECRHGKSGDVQAAINEAAQFDFNSPYWQTKEMPDEK